MSSHAKELIQYKDSIPKILFMLTAKLTAQFENNESFINDAKLEFTVGEKTFVFNFHTDDEVQLNTSMKVIQDGKELAVTDIESDPWGKPLSDYIN